MLESKESRNVRSATLLRLSSGALFESRFSNYDDDNDNDDSG